MKTKPTEALKLIDETESIVRDIEIEAVTKLFASLACKLAFKEGQSNTKIKQLEWKKSDGEYWEAITPIGTYSITVDFGVYVALYDMDNDVDGEWRSLVQAQAAAQADFEKRVKECLDLKAQQKTSTHRHDAG